MIYSIQELGQINIHSNTSLLFDDLLHLLDRLMSISARPEPKAAGRKGRVEDRGEHLSNGLLYNSINNRWNAQQTLAAIGFVDLNTPDRLWVVVTCKKLVFYLVPLTGFDPGWECLNRHPIHPGSSFIGSNLFPCPLQIGRQ